MGNHKTLSESIKDVILIHGVDIVKDSRLSNILDDVASFDEVPAAKTVLRTILKNGYGARLLEKGQGVPEWRLRVSAFSQEITNNYGYQQEIVNYLFESIVYGLGWTNSLPAYKVRKITQIETKKNTDKYAISDLKGELTKLRKEYLQLLKKLLVVPAKTSAYYPASALTQLELVEGKIQLLCAALKINDGDWCQKEKEKVLETYYKDTSSLKKKAYSKAAIATIVAVIGGSTGLYYVNSMDDMENYNNAIQKGDTFMSSGLYSQAVSNYKEAYTNYDAFNSSGYKHDAYQKMETAVNMLIEKGNHDNDALLDAYNSVKTLLQLELTSSERDAAQDQLTYIETEIVKRVENGKNTLVLNVSANNGKLNDEGKILLNELLKLSPEDYWLNFINNKEQ